jgi:hypothetical protein
MSHQSTPAEERVIIAKAFAAIQAEMLPGLGVAWDRSGPAALLVAGYAVSRLWLEAGGALEDFLEMVHAAVPVLPALEAQLRPILIGDGDDEAD